MPEWLPKLSGPDLAIVLLTIGLCLGGNFVADFGDAVGRFLGAGKKKAE